MEPQSDHRRALQRRSSARDRGGTDRELHVLDRRKFKFADAGSNKKAFHGTITVTPPLVSSLTVTPKNVVYGKSSTIAGKLASGQSGQAVEIRAQGCQETTSTVVATVTTDSAGAFSYLITSAKFRSGIKLHVRVRASFGSKQVGPCYIAGRSNTIRS